MKTPNHGVICSQTETSSQPFGTRREKWPNAAFKYAENSKAVTEIISNFDIIGFLITKAKPTALS